MTKRYSFLTGLLAVILPFGVYIGHASVLKDWIIDDAGISFVYARNLAAGFGLVSQPGAAPVECYSNFSWVGFLTPFFALGLFDPIITPKILSSLLVLVTFWALYKALGIMSSHGPAASLIVCTFLAINTSFVIWTSSGLENPLYSLGLAVLLLKTCQVINQPTYKVIDAVGIGATSALIALTRPEGIIYAGLIPFFIYLILSNKQAALKTWVNCVLLTGLSFTVIYGGYLLFRWGYFNMLFPNTYYAKGGPGFDTVKNILLLTPGIYTKLANLNSSVGNAYGSIIFIGLVISWAGLLFRKMVTKQHLVLLSLYVISIMGYLLLPNDWMKEFRFATPVILFIYPCLFLAGELWLNSLNISRNKRLIAALSITVIFFLFSMRIFYNRTIAFASSPTISISSTMLDLGIPFNQAAQKLGLKNASLLVPDVGGTLYVSNLKIYDLGGLCDATISRTMGKDQAAFHDYIFENVKPVFIHAHWPWSQFANFDADPRFRRDYTPIRENLDPQNASYNGDFVRKDAVLGKEDLVQTLLP